MKKYLIRGVVVLAICGCAACGGTPSTEVSATNTEATTAERTEMTAEAAEKETQTEKGEIPPEQPKQQESEGAPEVIGMANPMKEYEDLETLEAALGFPMPMLSSAYQVKHTMYFSISGAVGEIRQETEDGHVMMFRKARGTDDISGVYGAEYKDRDVSGITIKAGALGEDMAAWWTDGSFAYSFQMSGVDEDTFYPVLEDAVAAAGISEKN